MYRTVVIRYRLISQIHYQDLKLKIKDQTIQDEGQLNKYIERYFELNHKSPTIAAFFVSKILRN